MAGPSTSSTQAGLRFARGQSIGARDYQEDSIRLMSEDNGVLAIVADGMGGHAAGDVASQAAADGFVTGFGSRRGNSIDERLAFALRAGNQAIADALDAGRGGDGMGCTISAVFADARSVAWISVGDSPVFLWSNGRLERISEDHSMAPVLDEMAHKGVISREEASADPERHALRSAVRGQAIELVDQGTAAFPEGAVLLIASDGLETLAREEIAAHVARRATNPDALVADLLSAVTALGEPDQDNVSVIAVTHVAAAQADMKATAGSATIARPSRNRPNWGIPAAIGIVAAIAMVAAIAALLLWGRPS
jgi:serine/threonine protein phosphatase PrpC